jgi:hypothetical protein
MEVAREDEQREKRGDGAATTGIDSFRHGARCQRHGQVAMLAAVAAVAGRPPLSVQFFFYSMGVRLPKKIKRATGRRGVSVPTYRNN